MRGCDSNRLLSLESSLNLLEQIASRVKIRTLGKRFQIISELCAVDWAVENLLGYEFDEMGRVFAKVGVGPDDESVIANPTPLLLGSGFVEKDLTANVFDTSIRRTLAASGILDSITDHAVTVDEFAGEQEGMSKIRGIAAQADEMRRLEDLGDPRRA